MIKCQYVEQLVSKEASHAAGVLNAGGRAAALGPSMAAYFFNSLPTDPLAALQAIPPINLTDAHVSSVQRLPTPNSTHSSLTE